MKKLSIEEIEVWVRENITEPLNDEDLRHVAECLNSIQSWYYNGISVGGFISAVLRNDFKEACFRADDANSKALRIYALFLHWNLPQDYTTKINSYTVEW